MYTLLFKLGFLSVTVLSSFLWFYQSKEQLLELTLVETLEDVYTASILWAIFLSLLLYYPLAKLYVYFGSSQLMSVIRIVIFLVYTIGIGLVVKSAFLFSQIV